ncbi:uncharacterized protein LOC127278235 [Leptopilina boulardi]|uniref:uncharacterized protein LOC127278235 n=1 Tax=Leptopilina boulardi TaxID=63433 RepID=UPI0021F65B32|nr:uncharacterized protein LOC127278235 [Leptopilina boulardi]
MVQFFVESYKKLEESNKGKFIKIRAYGKISTMFKDKFDINITAQQLESKMKGLQNTYKNKMDAKNKTGMGRVDWEHFEVMNEFMFQKPQITPVSTSSSLNGFKCKNSSSSSDEDISTKKEKPKDKKTKRVKKQRQRSPPQQRFVNAYEDGLERRDAFQDRFLKSFDRYVDIVDKKLNEKK